MIKQVDANLEDLLHSLIFDVIVKAAMGTFVAKFAFLALPIINPIFGALLAFVGQGLFDTLSQYFDFQAIDGEVSAEVQAYNKAVEGLSAALAVSDADPNKATVIDNAKQNFKDSLSNLIRFNMPTASFRLYRSQN